jgi:hypothetical protein
MKKGIYNGYTDGRRDKHKTLKLPIQVQLNVATFAQAANSLKEAGVPLLGKNQVIEKAFEFFMVNFGKNGLPFDELGALDYLASIGLPVTVDNKRHKKALDMYTRDTNAQGFVVPFLDDNVRAITSQQGVINHEAERLVKEFRKKEMLQQQHTEQNKEFISEDSIVKHKQELGLTGAVVCEEDQIAYQEYCDKQKAKGKLPRSIEDFCRGNIPIEL